MNRVLNCLKMQFRKNNKISWIAHYCFRFVGYFSDKQENKKYILCKSAKKMTSVNPTYSVAINRIDFLLYLIDCFTNIGIL